MVRLFVAGGNREFALSGQESSAVGKPGCVHSFDWFYDILTPGVTSCTSISYYAQSLQGHVQIIAARQDIGKLIDDPSTPEILRARMASAAAI
ncbi:hypothetical protein [Mesorhizobium sp. M0323]|uniref:hypothetical protein n=1 Tax=Mesorhizobium sp. M0323 TaxID=2956938 RepID=UPI0033387959